MGDVDLPYKEVAQQILRLEKNQWKEFEMKNSFSEEVKKQIIKQQGINTCYIDEYREYLKNKK